MRLYQLRADLVANVSIYVDEYYYMNHNPVNVSNVSFCNVSVTYSHQNYNDQVNVQVWLPIDTWNECMIGLGGRGWQAGLHHDKFRAMDVLSGKTMPHWRLMVGIRLSNSHLNG